MFCPNCGNQLPDGSKFCGNCGAQIAQAAQQPEAQSQPAYQPAYAAAGAGGAVARVRNGKAKWFILGGAVVVIAVVVILIVVLAGGGKGGASGVDAIVDRYFTAIEEGDVDAIVDLMPPELTDADSLLGQGMTAAVDMAEALLDEYGRVEFDSWEIIDREEADESDMAEANLVFALFGLELDEARLLTVEVYLDGEREVVDFVVVRIDGDWYLLSVD